MSCKLNEMDIAIMEDDRYGFFLSYLSKKIPGVKVRRISAGYDEIVDANGKVIGGMNYFKCFVQNSDECCRSTFDEYDGLFADEINSEWKARKADEIARKRARQLPKKIALLEKNIAAVKGNVNWQKAMLNKLAN